MKKHETIMIIDDDPVFSKLLSKMLSVHSEDTIITFSSSLDIFNDLSLMPSIVFIDYHMNDLNGLSTAKLVRKKWKNASIFLISESTNIRSISISKYGIDAKIPKNIGVEELAISGLKMNRKLRSERKVKSVILYTLSISFIVSFLGACWVFLR